MTNNEKWKLLVDLYNENYNELEIKIQQTWETLLLEVFGYSRLRGEIDSQRILHIGSFDRVIPDIIVKKDGKDIFVVELKQHRFDFRKEFEDQLFSYLRLLNLSVGILIVDKIYLYYFDHNKSNDEQYRVTIPFEEMYSEGPNFVNLFLKGNYSQKAIENYVNSKETRVKNVNDIVQQFLNEDYIKDLIIDNLQEEYEYEEIDEALNKVLINVSLKGNNIDIAKTKNVVETFSKTNIKTCSSGRNNIPADNFFKILGETLEEQGNPFMFKHKEYWASVNRTTASNKSIGIDFIWSQNKIRVNLYLNNYLDVYEKLERNKDKIDSELIYRHDWLIGSRNNKCRRIASFIPVNHKDDDSIKEACKEVIPIVKKYIEVFGKYIDGLFNV